MPPRHLCFSGQRHFPSRRRTSFLIASSSADSSREAFSFFSVAVPRGGLKFGPVQRGGHVEASTGKAHLLLLVPKVVLQAANQFLHQFLGVSSLALPQKLRARLGANLGAVGGLFR